LNSASPYPHNCRYPQTPTFSPNPAHEIEAAYTYKTHLARTPPVRRQARRGVHHSGEMGGGGVMQQTAISCP
ncbi:hypothetical protein PISMIDRAFT_687362, partial [Pisolithus microcarpus 441]